MASVDEIRNRLLRLCDESYQRERWKERGSVSPNPSKLIAEGIRCARKSIESTPVSGEGRQYLAAVRARIEETREQIRQNPRSEEGWKDEDGWMLGGLASIASEIAKLDEDGDRRDRGWFAWIRRVFGSSKEKRP